MKMKIMKMTMMMITMITVQVDDDDANDDDDDVVVCSSGCSLELCKGIPPAPVAPFHHHDHDHDHGHDHGYDGGGGNCFNIDYNDGDLKVNRFDFLVETWLE